MDQVIQRLRLSEALERDVFSAQRLILLASDRHPSLPGQFAHGPVGAQPERPELAPRFRVEGLRSVHVRQSQTITGTG